jgi:alkylated DNA repair dioxygenase AlkB
LKGVEQRPEGIGYHPDFLTPDEEQRLLEAMEQTDFRELSMRGQVARRTVRHYGLDYGYETWKVVPGDPLPPSLGWLQTRCADLAAVEPEELAQTLVTRYPSGAGIGWHRDAPMFGTIVGVSAGAAAPMRFQRKVGDERYVFELELEPRSAYVLAGEARNAWQHSIPPTKELRYSITFRTLRRNPPERGG